jgi:hypothetical protein
MPRYSLKLIWHVYGTYLIEQIRSPIVSSCLTPTSTMRKNVMSTQTKMLKTTRTLMAVVFGSAIAFGAAAKDADYKAAKDTADATYDAAKDHCDTLSGNDKDVCMKQAKANKTKADADAKTRHETREAAMDGKEDKMESQYKVAKEKCDALSGAEQDACVSRAKATYHQ